MNKINKNGYIAGAIVWVLLVMMLCGKQYCIGVRSCNGGDFFLFWLLSIGMLAPAWVAAVTVSSGKPK